MSICANCGHETAEDRNFCPHCGAWLEAAATAGEARKTVTVVVCDIRLTELGESTDPEALRALLARYFGRMKGIVEAHGGSMERLIGDAVIAVFGVPLGHAHNALRACRAAIEMRDALPEFGVEGRIGVNTGEVLTGGEERLASGDAVNVATRLEQAADPGEVLIGTEALGLVRAAVDIGEVRLLELTGKSEPVAAHPLLAVREAAEGLDASSVRPRAPEVERPSLSYLLSAAARAGVVPAAGAMSTTVGLGGVVGAADGISTGGSTPPSEPAPPSPPAAPGATTLKRARSPQEILEEHGFHYAAQVEDYRPMRRQRRLPVALGFAALTMLGGLAIAKWLLGWFTIPVAGETPEADEVQCTVFAPAAAPPGSTIFVQVFAHLPDEADDARAIATELDVATQRRAFRSLETSVSAGTRLDFELRLSGLEIDDCVASLIWQRRTEAVQFGVYVPPTTPIGTVIGTVSISCEGVPVGHVKFQLAIANASPDAEPQGIEARRYRSAFVSYASKDRDEVLRRVQMLPVSGLRYFQDVLDLEPGEIWSTRLEEAIREADVFLLFWSSRAKASEWVRREVDFALALKEGNDSFPPEIRPVIIEGPPVIPPWDELAHLHFNDRVLYFMSCGSS